ncbi:MAG: hypothetical protein H6859_07475 [Rhodospirillales bacterium]|nr:hypothetical protein [Alphaproteobacteria bacterium]USO04993.1 MAG: hypothetical protein H6859_07475 [Rhodospirillales bacterium]
MNIDLLFTAAGEAGLISSENLVKKVAGVVFDIATGTLTFEYVDMDFLELNIPVEKEFNAALDVCPQIHIGAIKDGNIAQAYQVPFMFLDDPYRGEAFQGLAPPSQPLEAFDYFVKSTVFGQPVHREDLGDESAMGCVLGDAVPSALQFAPHLARRHQMEIAPKSAPNAPGPTMPGLGAGGGHASGSAIGRITRGTGNTIPPKKRDE